MERSPIVCSARGEIGERMALGASRGVVFRMIYRQSVVMVAAGLGIGEAGAAEASGIILHTHMQVGAAQHRGDAAADLILEPFLG